MNVQAYKQEQTLLKAVSYTHLDVYKRQVLHLSLPADGAAVVFVE